MSDIDILKILGSIKIPEHTLHISIDGISIRHNAHHWGSIRWTVAEGVVYCCCCDHTPDKKFKAYEPFLRIKISDPSSIQKILDTTKYYIMQRLVDDKKQLKDTCNRIENEISSINNLINILNKSSE